MFKNKRAAEAWRELGDAIDNAKTTVPCSESDPDAWFPEFEVDAYSNTASYKQAKALCAQCPVQALCLSYALIQGEEYGMWGGLTPYERKSVKGIRRGVKGRPPAQA